jgi:hypothetical protein
MKEGDPSEPVVFQHQFPTATGRAKLVPADIIPAAEWRRAGPVRQDCGIQVLRDQGDTGRRAAKTKQP